MDFLADQIRKRQEIVKFVMAGGTAALVNFGLFYFLTEAAGLWYLFSSGLSFVASFFVSFFLQKFWTFKDKNREVLYEQIMLYLLMAFLNLVFNTVAMYVLVDLLGVGSLLSQLLVIAIISFWNFITYKFFIFNQKVFVNGQQLKILIATGIYPPDVGGPATLLTELPSALKKQGISVKIVTYSDVGLSRQEKPESEVYRIKRGTFFSRLVYFWRLWQESFWCDAIYATDTYSVGYFVYLIKKIIGKKYILRFAGDSAWETAAAKGWTEDYIVDFQNKKYNCRIERMKKRRTKILLGADKVVAVSNFIAGLAKVIGVAEQKIRVIYNAVDFFGEAPAKAEPAEPTLVFAGRLMPWKGVAMLLRVVAKLKTRWPKIVFEVLGDGPKESFLRELAKSLGLGPNVKFRGRVSEEQSRAIFVRSTIFVLNTNYEGLPHSALNAFSCGLPVIMTSIGGNPEVVQDGVNGLLVPYNDEKAWQEAISRLLTDEPLRKKFAENGKKTLEKFRWNRLVEETMGVIKSLF